MFHSHYHVQSRLKRARERTNWLATAKLTKSIRTASATDEKREAFFALLVETTKIRYTTRESNEVQIEWISKRNEGRCHIILNEKIVVDVFGWSFSKEIIHNKFLFSNRCLSDSQEEPRNKIVPKHWQLLQD